MQVILIVILMARTFRKNLYLANLLIDRTFSNACIVYHQQTGLDVLTGRLVNCRRNERQNPHSVSKKNKRGIHELYQFQMPNTLMDTLVQQTGALVSSVWVYLVSAYHFRTDMSSEEAIIARVFYSTKQNHQNRPPLSVHVCIQ